MSNFAVCSISRHDNWRTPSKVIESLDDEFHFTRTPDGKIFDPTPCPRPEGFDGLAIEWADRTYFNPPYSRSKESTMDMWCEKAYRESQRGKTIVGVLRGDTSTAWFHNWVLPYAELRFVRGRLKFNDTKPAPFPSIIAIWRPGP